MTNTSNTKNKLTIIFTIIIFIVIFLFGLIYFTSKYINDSRREFSFVRDITSRIEKSPNPLSVFKNLIPAPDNTKKIDRRFPVIQNDILNINYILIQDNEVISLNIRDKINDKLFYNILDLDKYLNIQNEDSFLIKKFNLSELRTLVIFKKLNYSREDYIGDILGFLLINFILSGLLYFLIRYIVKRIFIPVDDNINDMKNFIHNAGHELKTPLAVIDSNIQLIKELKTYDEDLVSELKDEVLKTNSLIDSLINLSDIGSFKETDNINLSDIIEEIVKDFSDKINNKSIKTNINIPEGINIKANKNYLYIFLSNIIGNAIKYNKTGGNINIKYNSKNLIISDSGEGISKDDLDKIFNRFYKADKSRNTEGFGIGLSLVKKIADTYNWKIKVISSKGKLHGTSFSIKF